MASTLLILCLLASQRPGPCKTAVPPAVVRKLEEAYPTSRVVTLQSLNPHYRKLYKQEGTGGCPGVASADFFGEGHDSYAVVLKAGRRSAEVYRLVVARRGASASWTVQELEEINDDSAPAVFAEPPGRYESISDDKILTAVQPVIHLVGYESWAIIYGWTGQGFEKVWTSD